MTSSLSTHNVGIHSNKDGYEEDNEAKVYVVHKNYNSFFYSILIFVCVEFKGITELKLFAQSVSL